MKKAIVTLLALTFTVISTSAFAERVPLINQNYLAHRPVPKYVYVQTVDSSYFQYTNGRFGMSGYVPSNFYLAYGPSNGDGARFSDGLGGELTISGYNNVLNKTLSQLYKDAINTYQPSYHVSGTNWFVISYERNGKVYYLKTFLSNKFVKSLSYVYPASNRYHYEAYLSTIERTFRP